MENINVTSANGTTHSMTGEELENLLSCVTSVEDVSFSGCRFFYHIGDNFIIELTIADGLLNNRYSLMNLWKRHGFIKERFERYLGIQTYFYEGEKCSGKYNVTNDNGKVNFNYLFENTEENIKYIIAKCIQLMKKGEAIQ